MQMELLHLKNVLLLLTASLVVVQKAELASAHARLAQSVRINFKVGVCINHLNYYNALAGLRRFQTTRLSPLPHRHIVSVVFQATVFVSLRIKRQLAQTVL